jgi:hypothetical protein
MWLQIIGLLNNETGYIWDEAVITNFNRTSSGETEENYEKLEQDLIFLARIRTGHLWGALPLC